jgi:hypothetical protein
MGGIMFKPLAVAVTAGLLFTLGCKTQDPEEQALSKIPTVAPADATNPDGVLVHLQYAMVRNDPKHLEKFAPENRSMSNGATQWFHSHSGDLGLTLTEEEIGTMGVQDLVQNGYLSDKWTQREFKRVLKELDEGKRKDFEPGMERVNQQKLDMPYLVVPQGTEKRSADAMKKHFDTLDKQRVEVLEANPKPIYAAGLYRLLKCIPPSGWPLVTDSVHNNAGGKSDLKDIVLAVNGDKLATLAVGRKSDGTMYISYARFEKYPEVVAKLFPSKEEAAKEGADS